jgi:hypothetical protein
VEIQIGYEKDTTGEQQVYYKRCKNQIFKTQLNKNETALDKYIKIV